MLIKAAAGGGGKGMRVCRDESNLAGAIQTAAAEAEAAFKNASIYLEKFIDRPRHVEVQILADSHGEIVSCWDRDCTLQRRHQKLVEESPAPTLPLKVRTRLSEAAVRLAKAVGYVNAGTCEFLVDSENNFYFIEVNARIQVEHPVTEMVTGIDLVKQQIKIAAGEPLPFRQKDIMLRGHAIECRINSEDPDNDFRPSPGRITNLRLPGGPGVRWDSHIYPGYVVPPYYDSLLGKLIVHAPTRPEAIATMRRALDELLDRRRSDHDSTSPPNLPRRRLHLRTRRHDVGRTRLARAEALNRLPMHRSSLPCTHARCESRTVFSVRISPMRGRKIDTSPQSIHSRKNIRVSAKRRTKWAVCADRFGKEDLLTTCEPAAADKQRNAIERRRSSDARRGPFALDEHDQQTTPN